MYFNNELSHENESLSKDLCFPYQEGLKEWLIRLCKSRDSPITLDRPDVIQETVPPGGNREWLLDQQKRCNKLNTSVPAKGRKEELFQLQEYEQVKTGRQVFSRVCPVPERAHLMDWKALAKVRVSLRHEGDPAGALYHNVESTVLYSVFWETSLLFNLNHRPALKSLGKESDVKFWV